MIIDATKGVVIPIENGMNVGLRASVVKAQIQNHLGWGNNPYLDSLKEMVDEDYNGNITIASLEKIKDTVSDEARANIGNPIHKNQFQKLDDFLSKISYFA